MHVLVVDDEMDVKALFEQRFRKEIRDGLVSSVSPIQGKKHSGI